VLKILLAQTARMLCQVQQTPFFLYSCQVLATGQLDGNYAPSCTTLHHFAPLVTLMCMEIVAATQMVFFKKDLSADVDCNGCNVSSEGGFCLNYGFVASGFQPFRCLTKHCSALNHLPVVVAALIITGRLFTAISNYLHMIQSL